MVGAAGTALGIATRESAAGPTEQPAHFDLAAPSHEFFDTDRALHERYRVSQGFAFDNINRRLFVTQIRNNSDGDDLCISELDRDGNVVGYMHLDDVGHGGAIGVEPVGTSTYLWTEAASSSPDLSGRGTALQRFEFVSGEEPSDATTYLAGSTAITCTTDAAHRRLLVRRQVEGDKEYALYALDAARAGDFSAPLLPPLRIPEDDTETFQGFTFHGKYLYTLAGRGHSTAEEIDSTISCIDLTTGEVVQDDVLTRAGSTLVYREPEGMAVNLTPDGEPRLCFGFASRDSLDGGLRFQSIFYKDVLVT